MVPVMNDTLAKQILEGKASFDRAKSAVCEEGVVAE